MLPIRSLDSPARLWIGLFLEGSDDGVCAADSGIEMRWPVGGVFPAAYYLRRAFIVSWARTVPRHLAAWKASVPGSPRLSGPDSQVPARCKRRETALASPSRCLWTRPTLLRVLRRHVRQIRLKSDRPIPLGTPLPVIGTAVNEAFVGRHTHEPRCGSGEYVREGDPRRYAGTRRARRQCVRGYPASPAGPRP